MVPPFTRARDLAIFIRDIIDDNWTNKLSDEQARKTINEALSVPKNLLKVKRADEYTVVFQTVVGKRRMERFEKLMNNENVVTK